MELILLALVVAVVALWFRGNGLADRVARAEDDLIDLQVQIAELREPSLETEPVQPPSPVVPTAPAAALEPQAAATPSFHERLERERRQLAEAERRLAAASLLAEPSSSPAALVDARPPTAERPAALGGPVAVPRAVVPEPTGPGIVQRLLLRLGLTPAEEGEVISRAAIGAWLEGRMLAVVGGIALLLGAVFFLSLAFSRGWITEPMRVLIGLGAGAGLLVLGELAFSKLRGIVGHVLVAVGLAIVSLALFAATRLYGLVPVEAGLAGAFVAAVVAATIAVRHDSELVAGFGLMAVLAAPPVLGTSPTIVTLLFVAATLVGTTGVALFRTWVWLPPLAFVLAAPQLASYVMGEAPVGEALVAVAGFWLVNTVAAGGEETRHVTDRLRTTTVTLLLATAAYTIWAGFTVLSGPDEGWRGSFLAALAIAHLVLGLFFLARHGDRHPFGLVVAATGIAALTMAVPVQFGGPPVPIAWAAEAVALAWVAVQRRHPYSTGVALVLAALALGHLVAVEYPVARAWDGVARTWPFIGPEGMTYGFMMAGLAIGAVVVPIGWIRTGFAVVGGLVTLYVLPFELSGTALVAGWAILAVAATWLLARVVGDRLAPGFVEDRTGALALPASIEPAVELAVASISRVVRPALAGLAALAGVAAISHLVVLEYPPRDIVGGAAAAVPFIGLHGAAFAIVLAMLGVAGILVRSPRVRIGLAVLGGLVALDVFPFELSGPALVWAWAALAAVAVLVQGFVVQPRLGSLLPDAVERRVVGPAIGLVGAVAGLAVVGHLVLLEFPIRDLPIGDVGGRLLSTFPYAGPEGIALAGALAALAAIGWLLRERALRLATAGIGLALIVYSVTFEIDRPHVMVAWAIAGVAALAVVRRVALVEVFPDRPMFLPALVAERLPYAATGLAGFLLLVVAGWYAGPLALGQHLRGTLAPPATPFLDVRVYALAILAVASVAAGWTWGGLRARLVGGVAAGLVVAWLLPFEVRTGYAVGGWAALGLAGAWLIQRTPAARVIVGLPVAVLAGFGALLAITVVAPPARLVVDDETTVLGWPLLTDATVALGAIAIALAAGAYLHRTELFGRWALLAAGVAAVYMLSVGVVDLFQQQVGQRPLEELQKAAQVGLSVLWSIVGGLGFASGLRLHRPPVRLSGLALLGLATVKVFLVDLAALDVAYRVLSLVALGVLLLVSALIYARMQHPQPPTRPTAA